MSEIDDAYRRAREGDGEAFTSWVRLCEMPLRSSLRDFAAAVDVESVTQEGLLRMWKLAKTLELTGENASLRYALRLVRNIAISEAQRLGRIATVELERLESAPASDGEADRPPDDEFTEAVRNCFGKLPARPGAAMNARLRGGGADRDLAAALGLAPNTFLQNIVRARKLLRECLERAGINLEDYVR